MSKPGVDWNARIEQEGAKTLRDTLRIPMSKRTIARHGYRNGITPAVSGRDVQLPGGGVMRGNIVPN